ncbi:MAG: phosphate acyltransferase [Anaerovoracaceae bacterium]|jgi:phosphate butyryltransferase|nr:phosphate acyltransferase [Anaerovoracaceae bacterium]
MIYRNFSELFDLRNNHVKKTVVLAGAEDPHALEAVLLAAKQEGLEYILVGDKSRTQQVAKSLGYDINADFIISATSPEEAALLGVEQIRLMKGDFLMKGKMETSVLLKQVVDKERGIGTGNLMSHIAVVESPYYHKLLGITDGGMIPLPDLEQKKGIIKNALHLFHGLGYKSPKVGIMAAVEKMNPKIQETVDGQDLKDLSLQTGYFGDCILEGPISFDLAVSQESAKIKGYQSPVSGDVDIMLMPNLTAGNLTVKALVCLGNAKMAGCVLGAKVPIVVTSRGSSLEEKSISLLLCAAFA